MGLRPVHTASRKSPENYARSQIFRTSFGPVAIAFSRCARYSRMPTPASVPRVARCRGTGLSPSKTSRRGTGLCPSKTSRRGTGLCPSKTSRRGTGLCPKGSPGYMLLPLTPSIHNLPDRRISYGHKNGVSVRLLRFIPHYNAVSGAFSCLRGRSCSRRHRGYIGSLRCYRQTGRGSVS